MLMQTGNFSMITICADCLSSEDSLAARIESQSPEFLEGIMIPAGSTITVYATKDFGGPIEQEP
jgi:hypothetical protein